MNARTFLASMVILFSLWLSPAWSHEVRPALLQIDQSDDGRYDISWKRPTMGNSAVRLRPHIQGGFLDRLPDQIDQAPGFELTMWRGVDAGAGGLEGRRLHVEGLDRTITQVFVSTSMADGTSLQIVLTPAKPSVILRLTENSLAVPAYFLLGVDHILTGYDHLIFVLALVLLVSSTTMLLKTITAFTVAHSITLGLTATDSISINPAVVEVLVALSIAFLGVELVQVYRGHRTLMFRFPWVIAFCFGLLHGCAFAGALTDVGLPKTAVLPSLLLFNTGVEIGQLLFVIVVLAVAWVVKHIARELPNWSGQVPAYGIGTLGAFWFIDRMNAVVWT